VEGGSDAELRDGGGRVGWSEGWVEECVGVEGELDFRGEGGGGGCGWVGVEPGIVLPTKKNDGKFLRKVLRLCQLWIFNASRHARRDLEATTHDHLARIPQLSIVDARRLDLSFAKQLISI